MNPILLNLMKKLGRWISFTALTGDVFTIRERFINSMWRYPCANTTGDCEYPVHNMITFLGRDVPVSDEEFIRLAKFVGVDTDTLPVVKEGTIKVVADVVVKETKGVN